MDEILYEITRILAPSSVIWHHVFNLEIWTRLLKILVFSFSFHPAGNEKPDRDENYDSEKYVSSLHIGY